MIIIVLIVLGLMFGSFVNALVWRIHKQSGLSSKKAKSKYSIVKGRSRCTDCSHKLASIDLLPVISWLSLGGKCRYCKKPISAQYPLVETLMAILFVVSYVFWPLDLDSYGKTEVIGGLSILVGVVALTVYELREMLLPDKILLPVAIVGLFSFILRLAHDNSALLSTAVAIAIGGGLFYLLFIVSGGKWIGGGDVKLGFVLGLLVGSPELALLFIFLGSLIGFLYVLPMLILKKIKPKSHIPFGPFLIAGAFIAVIWGTNIIDWYTATFLTV